MCQLLGGVCVRVCGCGLRLKATFNHFATDIRKIVHPDCLLRVCVCLPRTFSSGYLPCREQTASAHLFTQARNCKPFSIHSKWQRIKAIQFISQHNSTTRIHKSDAIACPVGSRQGVYSIIIVIKCSSTLNHFIKLNVKFEQFILFYYLKRIRATILRRNLLRWTRLKTQ